MSWPILTTLTGTGRRAALGNRRRQRPIAGSVYAAEEEGLSKPGSPVLDSGHSLANGLIGAWLFVEGSGSSVADYSGRNQTMTLHNSPTWGDDDSGKMVTMAAASSQDGTTANNIFSNADLADGAIVLVCRLPVGATTGNIYLASIEGVVYLRLLTETAVFSSIGGTSLSAGSHAHVDDERCVIVLTWQDRTSAERYIDGIADGTCTPAAAVDLTTQNRPFAIGQFSNGSAYADVRVLSAYVYNRHLSQSEAADLTTDPWAMFR